MKIISLYKLLILVILYPMSSCTIHKHHYHTHSDKINGSSPAVVTITNNYTPGQQTTPEKTNAPTVVVEEKLIVKKIRTGCDKFTLPQLQDFQKLTSREYTKLNPKSHEEALNILLANIKTNKQIHEANQERIKESYDQHIKSCK